MITKLNSMRTMHFWLMALIASALSCSSLPDSGDDVTKDPAADGPQQETPSTEGSGETDGYTLVWQDLFDGKALDETVWNIEVNGNGGGNNELQYYRRENVSVGRDEASGCNSSHC